jgi:hypothetical protein
MVHTVFDAAQDRRIDDVARHPHHEKVTQALVENHFRGDAGIRAGKYRRERLLICRCVSATFGSLIVAGESIRNQAAQDANSAFRSRR